MARWGKNFVVPLDSLIKEKENTNRPVAARSAGTVGKWGKMGFTSTRTYAFKTFAAISPTEISDNLEASQATQTNDPPKPKKFFKSRNTSVDVIRTQIIHHLPRAPPSPIREISPKKDPTLKIKIAKPTTERKKSTSSDKVTKTKKKKEEKKKLKPEAPPSRIISRQRKVVNYNEEDDEEERSQTPLKDEITVPTLPNRLDSSQSAEEEKNQNLNHSINSNIEYDRELGVGVEDDEESEVELEQETEPIMEPPPVTPKQANAEHPPIVLRISKGTSRLISTDSEDIINSPVQKSPIVEQPPPAIASTEELLYVLSGESTPMERINEKFTGNENQNEMQFINSTATFNCKTITESEVDNNDIKSLSQSVEPPKYESLKIVIKTDALKNTFISEKTEKKTKSKKHKKTVVTNTISERHMELLSPKSTSENLTLMSPVPQSEKDFDSQSSILGSVSSKSTNQFPAVIADDSCVIRSHGSSDITSDLETSQHSSLVAPPSDIESRLESMMDCDDDLPPLEEGESATVFDGVDNKLSIQEEPLKEDILQVLTGGDTADEEENLSSEDVLRKEENLPNVTNSEVRVEDELELLVEPTSAEKPITSPPIKETVTRRQTRSRKGKASSIDQTNETVVESVTENSTRKKVGRVTRNNNNGNLKNNVNVLPPTRSYTRRKKTVQSSSEPQSLNVVKQQIQEASITESSAIDLPDAPTVDISTHSQFDEIALNKTNDKRDDTDVSELPTKVEEKQYKIKNKFKRTWYERDSKKVEEDCENSSTTEEPAKKRFNSIKKVNTEGDLLNVNNNNNGKSNGRNNKAEREPSSPHLIVGDEKPSVKLVISKKKGSIFKSRALVADQGGETNSAKKRAVYKHTWDDDNSTKEKEKSMTNTPTPSDSGDTIFDDDFNGDTAVPKFSRLTRQNVIGKQDEETVTSVKCDRKAKDYYTVVRNVKTAHQIQEIGEYQEMKDDVDYILDALQPHNPISTRCLSALQLATKCSIPAFRMHVRAHGTVGKFFKALKDAKHDLSLGLCTATIMFVLSQDTLNIDLDRDSLELMINLLEVDLKKNSSDEENATYERNKQKVRELCEEIKNQGKATHLNLETISTGTLAMETLLSLTSKKAGEWFKEELRELGGLEHIIKTICDCCYQISDYVVSWTEILLDKLKTIERCLRVLENISQQNEKNQDYILSYSNGHAIDTLFKLYKLCDSEIALYPTNDTTPKDNPGVVLREALVPTLKVLINLTHPFDKNATGSALLGQRAGIFDTSFHILLQAPNYVPERCIFELSILVLLLLINLTMYTIPNRTLIMKSHAPSDFGNQFVKVPAIKALIEYFYRCQEQAQLAEQNTDEILENPESSKKKPQSQEEMDETVTKLLQKAGHHMEHTLQASYAGILIGHLISESSDNEIVIRSYLKDHKFQDIINVLEKYYTFMNLTASSEATMVSHIKSTKNLIDYFKKCDAHSNDDDDDSVSGNYHHHNQNHNSNSGDIDVPSSSGSSISTRSVTTRYYKSYSQR